MGRRSGREAQRERGLPGAAGGSASPTPESASFSPAGVFESETRARWAKRAGPTYWCRCGCAVASCTCHRGSKFALSLGPPHATAQGLTWWVASVCTHGCMPEPVCTHTRSGCARMFAAVSYAPARAGEGALPSLEPSGSWLPLAVTGGCLRFFQS